MTLEFYFNFAAVVCTSNLIALLVGYFNYIDNFDYIMCFISIMQIPSAHSVYVWKFQKKKIIQNCVSIFLESYYVTNMALL